MSYRCLKRQSVQEGPYTLLPIRKQDMGPIKEWRNDQIAILRQPHPLSDEDQERYWQQVIVPGFEADQPRQVLLSFLKADILIGYGGLTYIDWNAGRAEVSFLLETSRAHDSALYREEHASFLRLLQQIAFQDLHFHRLFTETFDLRPDHIAVLEASGFLLEGRMKEHVKIGDQYHDSLIHGLVKP